MDRTKNVGCSKWWLGGELKHLNSNHLLSIVPSCLGDCTVNFLDSSSMGVWEWGAIILRHFPNIQSMLFSVPQSGSVKAAFGLAFIPLFAFEEEQFLCLLCNLGTTITVPKLDDLYTFYCGV